jgi:NADPH-dependent glutamate synthase beta subunit-like oxidoreductase/CO/xanthine dehydrogenase FAD-binding subunit
MKTFKHHNAKSLREAAALLGRYGGRAKVNAGGTDLLGCLKDNCASDYPQAIINIKGIAGLEYVKVGSRGLKVGALTKLNVIARSPEIRKEYPLLAEAARSVATPNLRNLATLGGNLAQDVRCWYYRYPQQIGGPITCLRKGGKICSALVGDNRYHSIFGAAPASDRRCASHCPVHVDIPRYLRLIRENAIAEAAHILLQYNPMPAITGRICPIFCEPNCNRGEYDEPVAIHSIERGVGDYILAHVDDFFIPPKAESGKTIAIIGSGPAGLAAAFYLRKAGHRVTVYERLSELGGMLQYSIPPFRLPREIVQKQIQALRHMGIQFEAGIRIDGGSSANIISDSDAVFVAGGTWRSLKLGVPGEDARGVHSALDYLKKIGSGETVSLGKSVIVIGGGSVAIDAARTARRTGSQEVHVVCLETRDLASGDRMPALDPEILEAEEEGIIIHPSLGIRGIVTENGRAVGIETMKCASVRDSDGRFNPQYDAAAPSLHLRGDSVIIAIGQAAEAAPFASEGNVFIGGDMAEGPSTVVQAVASAQKAVHEIEARLGTAPPPEEFAGGQPEYAASHFDDIPRSSPGKLSVECRVRNVDAEDVGGLSDGDIRKEASRCVSCGCLAVGPSDIALALVALDASIVTSRRTLPAQEFFAASASHSTVLEPDELIKEVRIPRPPRDAQQSYLKFTIRKPVDFAIVSVASVITLKNGVCSDARIALGAVAPAPLRATAAEAAIKGRPIAEDIAGEAARKALESVQPLGKNQYKADIARTLVKRSILGYGE